MTDIWHVIGLKGTGSDRFSVEDLFVPERHTATRDDEARREKGLLYRFSSLQLYAAGFAGVAMGIARSMLDAFVGLAQDKVPFRSARTLRDNQLIQSQVAQAEAQLSAARVSLLRSLREITTEIARVSATSTPSRSNCKAGRSISRPSGNICSASNLTT
jgi:alkylation response protein AidB-like acyl-CoA dehydrogenase